MCVISFLYLSLHNTVFNFNSQTVSIDFSYYLYMILWFISFIWPSLHYKAFFYYLYITLCVILFLKLLLHYNVFHFISLTIFTLHCVWFHSSNQSYFTTCLISFFLPSLHYIVFNSFVWPSVHYSAFHFNSNIALGKPMLKLFCSGN